MDRIIRNTINVEFHDLLHRPLLVDFCRKSTRLGIFTREKEAVVT
jgi:hypothetical protein